MTDTSAPIPESIAEAAAEWIVRRDGGPLSAQDELALHAWLAVPAHKQALDRLESLWTFLDADAPALGDLPPLPEVRACAPRRKAVTGTGTGQQRRKRGWTGAAIAASLALVMLGAIEDWPTLLRADYRTDTGERRSVTLEDGSTVSLDSNSAIAIDFSGQPRRVRLLAGAALFKVAPNPARPFTVEAAGGSATALGTAFAVREHDGVAELVVTEHSVKLVGNGRSQIVGEGRRADFSADALGQVEPAGDNEVAWTRGRLVVVNRRLDEVVAEIARYRHGYLAVSGSLAGMRVSGVYDLDHPLAAIDSIERSLHLASFRLSDRIIILHD